MGGTGSILLILQTLLSMVGIGVDTDADFDGFDVPDDMAGDVSADFSVFSFKSLMAFIAFFGWVGVVGVGREWSMLIILAAGVGVGLVAMFMVAYMLFQFQKLETSGTMRFADTLLQEGEVYLTIPAAGQIGKVTLEVNGNVRELSATSTGTEIRTGERVKVIDVIDNNVLLVEPVALLETPDEMKELE